MRGGVNRFMNWLSGPPKEGVEGGDKTNILRRLKEFSGDEGPDVETLAKTMQYIQETEGKTFDEQLDDLDSSLNEIMDRIEGDLLSRVKVNNDRGGKTEGGGASRTGRPVIDGHKEEMEVIKVIMPEDTSSSSDT